VARAISLDQNVVSYLEGLSGRAYLCVYATRTTFLQAVADFFLRRFPRAIRGAKWEILVSGLLLFLGTYVGWQMVLIDPENFYAFVNERLAGGRDPGASTETLRDVLYDNGGAGLGELQSFAFQLFTHNARIGIMAFALGFALGIPVVYLIFTNGLMLGAFAGLYQSRGLGFDLWGWLLPHGITELLAVIVCGGAGLVLAQSIVFPGRHRRFENLARRGRAAGMIVLGAVLMFLIAGLIEGIFRQVVQDVPTRYGLATATALFWAIYFGFAGRDTDGPDGDRTDG
jgi:uncharacterized membrane protein SpoIIM required for sporulation